MICTVTSSSVLVAVLFAFLWFRCRLVDDEEDDGDGTVSKQSPCGSPIDFYRKSAATDAVSDLPRISLTAWPKSSEFSIQDGYSSGHLAHHQLRNQHRANNSGSLHNLHRGMILGEQVTTVGDAYVRHSDVRPAVATVQTHNYPGYPYVRNPAACSTYCGAAGASYECCDARRSFETSFTPAFDTELW